MLCCGGIQLAKNKGRNKKQRTIGGDRDATIVKEIDGPTALSAPVFWVI